LIVAGLFVLAIGSPLIIGLVFGTGSLFHAIPFGVIGWVAGVVIALLVRSRADVSVDRPRLLVEEMHDRVIENSLLFSVPLASTTVLNRGRTITNGPFPPADCSRVLCRWFEAGWVDVVDASHPESWVVGLAAQEWEGRGVAAGSGGADPILAHDDAQELLRDTSRWSKDSRDGLAMLSVSDEGSRHPWQEWIASGLEVTAS
jgi:hypothetical protein